MVRVRITIRIGLRNTEVRVGLKMPDSCLRYFALCFVLRWAVRVRGEG
jgi:hypothetical protein